MIYSIVLILLLFLSFHYDIKGKTKNRDKWYVIVLIIFILLAGLRYRLGIDTHRYLYYFYHDFPSIDQFSLEDLQIGEDPLYVLLNSIVHSLGGRFYMVQLIQATFVNVLVMSYFKKHCDYIFTCAFFYFSLSFVGLMMEIMRASFSIAICLYANDYIMDKKWIKGYLLFFIATFFHAQTLVLCVLPLLFFLRFNKIGILFLIISYFGGILLLQTLGDYVFLLEGSEKVESKVSGYVDSDIYGENTNNIGYYIVSLLPMIAYPLFSLWYCKRFSENDKLKVLEPFIMLGVMFVMVQASFIIAYRYLDFFRIYFALFFAETFVCMIKKNVHFKLGMSYARSLSIFLPLLIINVSSFFSYRYNPYSSVIDKTVVESRENKYKELGIDLYYYPKPSEY